jgi:2-polyprenyl-3-methyl-5-hydroxy-6-metoxy-1,4-benzoquinol methylase
LNQELEQLRKSNPHRLEPPRRSLRVDALMWVATRTGRRVRWPAYHNRTIELVKHEYDSGDNPNFGDAFAGTVKPEDLAGKDVLDVGCGWGGKAIALAERVGIRHLAGFDLPRQFKPDVVKEIADSLGLDSEWKTGYAESMPFADEQFDVALLDDVLEHVEAPPAVHRESVRVLRPGGLIIAKFPSIKMMKAHHLDRAISIPAIPYIASMRTWSAGLNDCLLRHPGSVDYVPFSEVVRGFSGWHVLRGFSGLDWRTAKMVTAQSPFSVRYLALVGAPRTFRERVNPAVVAVYETLRSLPPLREFLSSAIAFVGERVVAT